MTFIDLYVNGRWLFFPKPWNFIEIDYKATKLKWYGPISPGIGSPLRSTPRKNLSETEVKMMLLSKGLFDSRWNKDASGYPNQFELRENDVVIVDHSSGLMWQRANTIDSYNYNGAQKYISELNRTKQLAGYSDWRLPTLEEAMSLMEAEERSEYS